VTAPAGLPSKPTPAHTAKVMLDIDPAVTAGFINDRYDVLVRGRVVANQPVESVTLLRDGAVVSLVGFGTTAETGPRQHAFHVNVPLGRKEATGHCKCFLTVKLTNGEVHEQYYEFVLDGAAGAPVSIRSGRTLPMSAYANLRPAIILYVERAVLDDSGRLQLIGWAVSQNPMATIRVFLGDELVEGVRVGGRRDDVGTAFPAYPNARMSGFSLAAHVVEVDAASGIRVQAVTRSNFTQDVNVPLERVPALNWLDLVEKPAVKNNVVQFASEPMYHLVAGFQVGPGVPASLSTSLPAIAPVAGPTQVAPSPPGDPRRHIRFFCDEISLDHNGQLSVNGWSVCAVGISAVSIYLDDNKVGEAELGLLRDDVGDEYRHIPMARYSGFRFKQTLGDVPSGERRIRVVFQNGLDDVHEESRIALIDRIEPRPSSFNPQQFRLEIDTPTLAAGAAVEPITGRLTIEGWALARSGISGIEVLLDDQRLGDAHYGLARQDVGSAFPDWTESLRSGYAFHCPPRSLRNGEHVVQLNVQARSGEVFEYRFNIQVRKSEEFEEGSTIRRRMTLVEANVAQQVLDGLAHRPGFRLILRQGSILDIGGLLATLQSLRSQVYRDWRLEILPVDTDAAQAVRALVAEAAEDLSERIDVLDPLDDALTDQPLGWSEGRIASRFVGLLGAGDQLGCDALLQMALATGLHRKADLIYADEARLSPASHEREPFFKPDYSPDLLLSTNYFGRPWFASTALLGRCGARMRELQENGEYDLALRCAERAAYIHHVPKLLCLRGTQPIDDADMEEAALARAAARRGAAAEVRPAAVPGTWRLRRTAPVSGKVSIIIPTCASKGYIETCIKSLRERTTYPNIEIVCVDNIPDDQIAWKIWLRKNADKVAVIAGAFNWSQFNNLGADVATGEYLLFLNDDIEVIQPDWLDALLEHAHRPEVAVVGPQLLYPDNKVQHAGMFLATPGTARHAFRFGAADEPGYFGLALTQRNVIAVTGACMLMRRTVYEALGRFEEAHEIINNDLDFCLRAHQAGKLTVYTPYATLLHYEAASRDRLKDVFDLAQFEERWKTIFATGDPYFSPRLNRHSDDYRPDDEPVEVIYAGHPLFRHDEIKRILVVKVDHIGDFVTAIPAIRRLKQIFPGAAIHVLAGRAARAFAEFEDCIDEFIEFEFFHAVSGLGQKEISKEEYEDLRERLRPYRFDIAVDLRKHLDTRDVLRYTPARFLAGYDYMGQFPFLDISLEWEGDKHLLRKRSHVTDDLINLVEAIGTAGMSERTQLNLVAPASGAPEFLPDDAKALFDRPVVAVHPGVGNIMRQWPAEHFATLVDLLVERNEVNVVLIGGPEERELADEVREQVMHRDAVVSLVGRTSLRQLPELLRACVLYVGNNSGPKHIAAALGVPTIGIHSGVVDAVEWGPIGARAVAVRRNMACSPCYLARPEDCPRAFACMRGLEPNAVQEVAETFLARPVSRSAVTPLVEREFVAPLPEPMTAAAPIEQELPAEAASPRKAAQRRGARAEQPAPRSRRRRSRQDTTVSAD
jgi:ADP-heptose:LPS heptosyltransferase/GT2 family glycosyltransferase